MISFSKISILLISLVLISCGQEKKDQSKEKLELRYDKQKNLDTLNKTEALNLTVKLDAISGKDSSIKFTYQLQERVKKENKPISFIGNINDITYKDSNYVLKIYGTFAKQECIAEILVSAEIFHELYKHIDPKSSFNKGCFIFKPINIKSSTLLTINSEISDAETVEDASSILTYDFHDGLLVFKGSLVDYYLYKKLAKDNN